MPIHSDFDKLQNKFYYQFGDTGKKYYFDSLDGEQLAYNNALDQAKAIKANQGGVLLGGDVLGNGFDLIRQDFPPYVRDLIAKFGDSTITHIVIVRKPLNSVLTGVLNLVSRGQVNEQLKRLNYDDLFHLFILIGLDNGRILLLQKDEVIDMYIVTKFFKIHPRDRIDIPLQNKQIKLKDFIDNTVKMVGPSIYRYNGVDNNCQVFIVNLLKANGLLNDRYKNFIMQDVKEVLSTSPGWIKKVMNLATDSKAVWNRIVYGEGY